MDVIINNPASTPVAPVAAPVTMTGQVYAAPAAPYPNYGPEHEEHHSGFGGFFLFPLLFILGAGIFLRRMRRRFMRGGGGGARGNWGRGNWNRDNWDRSNWNSQNGSDARANANEPRAEESKGPENFSKSEPSSNSSGPTRPDMGERREWWEAFIGERSGRDKALEIARERFAKGEIRYEEFETIRRGLMSQG